MIKHLMVAALAALTLGPKLCPAAEQHLDGAYLADKSYGTKGDSVVAEVKKQIKAYEAARADALAFQGGGEGKLYANLTEAQLACANLALYSWVRANYLAELGRREKDNAKATAYYVDALASAQLAQTVDTNEADKTAKSKVQGEIIEKVIRKALKRLGAGEQ